MAHTFPFAAAVLSGLRRLRRSDDRPRPPSPTTVAADRVYAVGDVHGRVDLMREIEAAILVDHARDPVPMEIVYVGDLIDRGPDSAAVLDRLASPASDGVRRAAVLGNHEAMMLDVLTGRASADAWLRSGGDSTLASYGIDPIRVRARGDRALRMAMQANIPQDHLDLLADLPVWLRFGPFVLVHAGVDPRRPLADQDARDLLWIREPFLSHAASLEAVVVHGHSPQADPCRTAARIGVDLGSYATDRLAAARLDPDGTSAFLVTGGARPTRTPETSPR